MKALLVSYFYEHDFGGAELVARATKKLLEERMGWSVEVACFNGGTSKQLGAIHRLPIPFGFHSSPQWFKRFVLFLNNPLLDRIAVRQLRKKCDPAKFDCVHCQDLNSLLVADAFASECRLPLILTLHEPVPKRISPGVLPPFIARCVNAFMSLRDERIRQAVSRCHTVICVSEFVRKRTLDELKHLGAGLELVIAHPPVEDYLFAAASQPITGRTASFPARLLYIGRMTAEKGLDLLIESLPLVKSSFELSILGFGGPIEGRIRAMANKDARIKILQAVPHTEVAELIQSHEVVCCPSVVEEACPKTVAEARLFGRHIVATDRGGIPEILENYPRAYIVEFGSKTRGECVAALAEKIDRAIAAGMPQPFAAAELKVEDQFKSRFGAEPLYDVFRLAQWRIKERRRGMSR